MSDGRNRVAELEAELQEARAHIERLRGALLEIEDAFREAATLKINHPIVELAQRIVERIDRNISMH
mgnify:CR=1 FL=1